MVKIQCINPNCPSPTKTFDWDESPFGKIVQPDEPEAKRIIAYCKMCAYENPVWVKKIPTPDPVYRGGKKREQ
jgi:hypothetical protein